MRNRNRFLTGILLFVFVGVLSVISSADSKKVYADSPASKTENASVNIDSVQLYSKVSVDASAIPTITQVSVGTTHTCALTSTGGVKCWGLNDVGQLGDGTTINRATPVDVVGLSTSIIAISSGDGHSCALTNLGRVKCWGFNQSGQLGNGVFGGTYAGSVTPVDVVGLSTGVYAISAGGWNTCALVDNGSVKCWGFNRYGQLGDGTTIDQNKPIDVTGLSTGFIAVSVEFDHACALTSVGQIKCWGTNTSGQLGDGTISDRSAPVEVVGLSSGVKAISIGNGFSCALTNKNGVNCWGGQNYFGSLGDGTTSNHSTPQEVVGLASGVTAISSGGIHSCALTQEGVLWCWGRNVSGELGDGTTNAHTTPVKVLGLFSEMKTVEAGGDHTCALTSAGGVKCWGSNSYGQLGDGSTTNRLTPVDVVGLTGNSTTYSISGRIVDDLGKPLSGVSISITTTTGRSVGATTNNVDGSYLITSIPGGTYQIYANKDGYVFTPYPLTVILDANRTGQHILGSYLSCILPQGVNTFITQANMCRIPTSKPFLDLPFSHSDFSRAASSTDAFLSGKVTAWVDHDRNTSRVWTWSKSTFTDGSIYPNIRSDSCSPRSNCYNQHEGTDFGLSVGSKIYPAATGVVSEVCRRVPSTGQTCGRSSLYGNYVLVNHENGYATLYAHLSSIENWVQPGVRIYSNMSPGLADPLGVVGHTGCDTTAPACGTHLHFSLLFDLDNSGTWTSGEEVDPYGPTKSSTDPMGRPNLYMWKYPLEASYALNPSTSNQSVSFDQCTASFPPAALTSDTTVSLGVGSIPGLLLDAFRTVSQTFFLNLMPWNSLTTGTNANKLEINQLPSPILMSISYDPSNIQHLVESQIAINWWDDVTQLWVPLATNVDTTAKIASAQTSTTGSFLLQGPLICPSAVFEPNDNLDNATTLVFDGNPTLESFDIPTDQDWFRFDALSGQRFLFYTANLAGGVNTVMEIIDIDGVSTLTSDDNSGGGLASSIEWFAPKDGAYYVKISQASGSSNGCEATYELITATYPVLSSLEPNSMMAGSPDFELIVRGSNFNSSALVHWNGVDLPTTFINDSQLNTQLSSSLISIVESVQVTVKNSSLASSNPLQFNIFTFADVIPGTWYYRYVEGFYAKRITTGCNTGPLRYCPDRAVTRAEMAVFVLRSQNADALPYTPDPDPSVIGAFADVPFSGKEWMQPWIEEFYQSGMTTGCNTNPLRYCPERQVTRAEMAVFVLRAVHGKDYVPPTATGVFSDVPVSGKEWMQPWIEQFYREGITTGCAQSPLRYCPEQPVTRAEMATFLDRAFGFPQLP